MRRGEKIWHAHCPTLSFIGLQNRIVPFPLFEIQAEAIHAQMIQSTLPPLSERIIDAQKDFTSGGLNGTGRVVDTHVLGSHQWDYCRSISKISGCYNEELEKYISTNKVGEKFCYNHSFVFILSAEWLECDEVMNIHFFISTSLQTSNISPLLRCPCSFRLFTIIQE